MNFIASSLAELARSSRLFIVAAATPVTTNSRLVAATAHAYYKVVTGDIAEGIIARKWSAAQHYEVARAGVPSALTVAINASGQVFSCILKGPGATSTAPVVQDAPEVFTADGYGWRYLYTVDQAFREKFLWENGIMARPMPELYTSTFETVGLPAAPIAGTPHCYLTPSRPAVVPYAVKDGAGLVTAIMLPPGAVVNPDELYACVEDPTAGGTGATAVVTVNQDGSVSVAAESLGTGYGAARITIVGDGTGAVFTASTSAGAVIGYTLVSAGTGYTHARAVITAGANSAVVAAILPSVNHDFTRSHALLSKSLTARESGASSLTAFLVITDAPFDAARASGPLGDHSIAAMQDEPLVISRVSGSGEFSMTENIQINTAVRTG